MAMLIDVSSNIRAARPIRMADDTASPKLPALLSSILGSQCKVGLNKLLESYIHN